MEVYTRLQRIAQLAKEDGKRAFLSLAHHIDEEWMKAAYERTRKDGAPGIDGVEAKEFEGDLEGNLRRLVDMLKSGQWRAPAVKRVYIPKGEGKRRPIGIPTLADKVLQRAVTMVLEAVYEQDFLDCSYGFRPKRSAHQALAALREALMGLDGGWVLEVDIKSFFDTLDHGQLRSFLDQRVRDGVLRRTIDKWLKAGVLEGETISYPEQGTPQGGVISPLLANIYLHEVLDKWFEEEVKPRLKGRAVLVRYADDFVMVFEREEDARRVLEVLPKRFGRFGLQLHPEKTRQVWFGRPRGGGLGGRRTPGSFDFLGYNHHWGKSLRGGWVVKQTTASRRFTQAVKRIGEYCRHNRHKPVREQHRTLSQKLMGHFHYFGITGNSRALSSYRHVVTAIWRKWLDRRSQRARMNWERFTQLQRHYPLPRAICYHSILRHAANP